MEPDLNKITAKINEGHRLIEEAIAKLNAGGIRVVEYYYKEHSLQILSGPRFVEMFPDCIAKDRESIDFPTELSTVHNGLLFFTLSSKPFPKDGTEPVKEAV